MKLIKHGDVSRILAVVALSVVLAACGGGSGGESETGDGSSDTNTDAGALDPLGDEDNDGIPNNVDVDQTGGVDDNFDGTDDAFQNQDNSEGSGGGDGGNTAVCEDSGGSDETSATADWSDNCTVSRNGPHKQSNYTRGIQRMLNCLGHAVTADADFGPNTESAVIAFQTENAPATVDGIVGPETWGLLQDTLASQNFDSQTLRHYVDNYDPDGDDTPNSICFGQTLFYQAINADTGAGGGWEMAKTPGAIERIPFSIGIDAVE